MYAVFLNLIQVEYKMTSRRLKANYLYISIAKAKPERRKLSKSLEFIGL